MAGTAFEQQFFNSCVTEDYPCTVGEKFVNPCMCSKFYLCEHKTSIIQQSCSDGTLFNHESGQCEQADDVAVIDKLCNVARPWERCSAVDSEADISALKERCTGIRPTPGPGEGGQSGDNTGAIVGGVIAALLIIALIVIIIIFLKKRGKPMSHYMGFLTLKKTANNPEYDNKDETYAEINDMGDPVYKESIKAGSSPKVPDRPSFTLSPALNVSQDNNKVKGRPATDEVAYDNPGYTPSIEDDDIIQGTTSLKVSAQKSSHETIEAESDRLSYSGLEQASVELPSNKAYTPLSVYTRGPNPNASPQTGGILQLNDNEYQVPKPMPDYYELEPGSSCVS